MRLWYFTKAAHRKADDILLHLSVIFAGRGSKRAGIVSDWSHDSGWWGLAAWDWQQQKSSLFYTAVFYYIFVCSLRGEVKKTGLRPATLDGLAKIFHSLIKIGSCLKIYFLYNLFLCSLKLSSAQCPGRSALPFFSYFSLTLLLL